MKKRKTILVLVILVVLAVLAWRYLGGGGDARTAAESPDLAVNRVWVDSKAESYSDMVHAFLLSERRNLGIFQAASQYSGRYDVFEFRRQGAVVDLEFLQDGRAATFEYTVTACSDLRPYDLCLDMKSNPWGGPTRFYSMRDAEEDAEELGALQRALEAAVDRPASAE